MADYTNIISGLQGAIGSYADTVKAREDREERKRLQDLEFRAKGLLPEYDDKGMLVNLGEDPAYKQKQVQGEIAKAASEGKILEADEKGLLQFKGYAPEYIAGQKEIYGAKQDPLQQFIKTKTAENLITEQKEKSRGTEGERKAVTFADRLQQAENVFSELDKSGYNRADIKEGLRAKASEYLPIAKGALLGKQEQAERNFINSILRRESGAAISPSEFESAEMQYFPRVGDSPEVLEQKKENRRIAREGLKQEAGRAYEFQNKQKGLLSPMNAEAAPETKEWNGQVFEKRGDQWVRVK